MSFKMIPFFVLSAALLLLGPNVAQAQTARIQYNGLVKFWKTCSTSIIRFHESLKTDKAILLANAHCIRVDSDLFPEKLKAAAKGVDNRRVGHFLTNFDIAPNWVYDIQMINFLDGSTYETKAKRVLYATHTLTDLALFELSETYAELEAHGIKPLVLSKRPAKLGEKIAIPSAQYERQFNCAVGALVPMLMTPTSYYRNAFRYTEECKVFKGTSGSPVISKETGEVIGINSFSNGFDSEHCIENGICEMAGNDYEISRVESGYATELYQIYSCLNSKRKIDLKKPGCKLFGSPERPN